jgi:hypothetical protein
MLPIIIHRRRAALALMAYSAKRPTAKLITRLITDLAHLARFINENPNSILVKAEHNFGIEEDRTMAALKSTANSKLVKKLGIDYTTAEMLKWIRPIPWDKLSPETVQALFPRTARYMEVAAENARAAHSTAKMEIFNELLNGEGVEYIPSLRTGEQISHVKRPKGITETIYLYRSRYRVGNPAALIKKHPHWYAPEVSA